MSSKSTYTSDDIINGLIKLLKKLQKNDHIDTQACIEFLQKPETTKTITDWLNEFAEGKLVDATIFVNQDETHVSATIYVYDTTIDGNYPKVPSNSFDLSLPLTISSKI